MIRPVPEHSGQGAVLDMTPKAVRTWLRTVPVPEQRLQTSGVVPFSQPEPPHSGQFSMRETGISLVQPKAASSKVSCVCTRMFSPRRAAFARLPPALRVPPPKKESKMSPISKSPKPPKPPPKPPAPP